MLPAADPDMRYFAMIDGRQYGPMELDDMVKEGVRPDTYVWCKGMPDWMKASDVPDICRYFRQRLSGALPSQRVNSTAEMENMGRADVEDQERLLQQLPPMAQGYVRKSGIRLSKDNFPDVRYHKMSRAVPILLYLICIFLILIGIMLM